MVDAYSVPSKMTALVVKDDGTKYIIQCSLWWKGYEETYSTVGRRATDHRHSRDYSLDCIVLVWIALGTRAKGQRTLVQTGVGYAIVEMDKDT